MTDTPPAREDESAWARLRRRKVVQWGLAYAATAWTLLQALEYAIGTFHWPDPIRPFATLVAVVGLPVVMVLAWFHGDRGHQRFSGVEIGILSALLLAGAAGIWLYEARREPANDSAAPAPVTRSPGAAAPTKSVAVLPFAALSSGVDDGYFADGLTEEIINTLTALPDLLVTARTSAFYFKGKNVPVPEIAAKLGVAHVVEGSVRRAGDRARITAQLVRAADGFHVWSETYDQALADPFAVQTRIAESVAAALGVLLDERRRAMMDAVGVRDVGAFVAYQRGVELFYRAHNEGAMMSLLARANTEFESAIARKPDFASAYFHHADYYAHFLIDEAPGRGSDYGSATGVDVREAEQRLLADLDAAYRYERAPDQRRVIEVLRMTVSDDWLHLDEKIARAFAGWDTCRHGLWIDQTAIAFGRGEAALAQDLKRMRCDPLASQWNRLAITAVWIGRPEQGLKYADKIEALRGRDRDVMHARILAYLALGRVEDAEALLEAGAFQSDDVSAAMSLLNMQVAAAAGRSDAWPRFRQRWQRDPSRRLVGAAVFGDRRAANQAAAEIDAMTLGPAILLRVTDRCGCGQPFDLAATQRFARLLREAGLRWSPPDPIKYPLKTW